MAEILELSDWEFKLTMINMLRILTKKVGNMQEEMSNASEEMEMLKRIKRKWQK